MLTVRKSEERGQANYGWLDTRHTFSFADFYDPQFTQFRSLRVMNEDWVAPGKGFGTHPHRDMEIVTYVLDGELEHRDSMGNGETLKAGEFQSMSAGSGITHSEFNPSADQAVHLYQIWLLPKEKSLQPRYDQKAFDPAGRQNQWQLVASPTKESESLLIQQDARIYLGDLSPNTTLSFSLNRQRHAWIQVLRGSVSMDGSILQAGDGVAVSDRDDLELVTELGAETMVFDLA